jgi:moderate conductance mechanosensitive channel
VLSALGRDVSPILASAGIAGIAIGLGAQNMVKDVLGGLFILIENQYGVEDVIKVGDNIGTVERLDLRRTVIRNADGAAVTIPNGEVRVSANLTRSWAWAVLDVPVSYQEDLARATGIPQGVAGELVRDGEIGPSLVGAPEILGIESFGDAVMNLRMRARTAPSRQWEVARAMRSAVKTAFDREQVASPLTRKVATGTEAAADVIVVGPAGGLAADVAASRS